MRQLAQSRAGSARNNEHIGRQVKDLLIERGGRQLTAPSIGLGAQLEAIDGCHQVRISLG